MKKHLNVDLIQSELRGGSAFFPGYKGSGSPTAPSEISGPETANQSSADTNSQPVVEDIASTPDVSANQESEATYVKQGVPLTVPRTVPRTDPRSNELVPKVKRPMKQRQPFDIYEDQYTRLKQIADSERGLVNGRGLRQMVREAIDAYLATKESPDKT